MYPDFGDLFEAFNNVNFIGLELSHAVQKISEKIYVLLRRGNTFYIEHMNEFLEIKDKLELLVPKLDDFTNNYTKDKRGNTRQSKNKYDLRLIEVLTLFCCCEDICKSLQNK